MSDHPFQPGTKWAPRSGRGKPREIIARPDFRMWHPAKGKTDADYVWWLEPVSWSPDGWSFEKRTVVEFRRWAGEEIPA